MSTVLPTPITPLCRTRRELSELRACCRRSVDHAHRPRRQRQDPPRFALAADVSLPVHWIDLSTVIDPDQVAASVRRELGLGEQPDRSRATSCSITYAIQSALFVFDNCEQISALWLVWRMRCSISAAA